MTKPALVVMAAGIGSRYGGLKQIDSVGPSGERIIDYSVFDALRAGFGKVVFVIKRSIEDDFREIIGKGIENHCETTYVCQELGNLPDGQLVPDGRTKPWGTGHATLISKGAIDGPFSVINADDFYGTASFKDLAKHLSGLRDSDTVANYCMVGYQLRNTVTEHGHVARGVCTLNGDNNLLGIRERTRVQGYGEKARYSEDEGKSWVELPLDSTVSMNLWGFTPSIFENLDNAFRHFLRCSGNLRTQEFFLPDVVNSLIQANRARVKVIPTKERWVGVTYRRDKPIVKRHIQALVSAGIYPENLWA